MYAAIFYAFSPFTLGEQAYYYLKPIFELPYLLPKSELWAQKFSSFFCIFSVSCSVLNHSHLYIDLQLLLSSQRTLLWTYPCVFYCGVSLLHFHPAKMIWVIYTCYPLFLLFLCKPNPVRLMPPCTSRTVNCSASFLNFLLALPVWLTQLITFCDTFYMSSNCCSCSYFSCLFFFSAFLKIKKPLLSYYIFSILFRVFMCFLFIVLFFYSSSIHFNLHCISVFRILIWVTFLMLNLKKKFFLPIFELVVFLLILKSCQSSLCILYTNPLSDM